MRKSLSLSRASLVFFFYSFAPLSCKPGATAFSLSSMSGNSRETSQSSTPQAATGNASIDNASQYQAAQESLSQEDSSDLRATSLARKDAARASLNKSITPSSDNFTEATFVSTIANTQSTDSNSIQNSSPPSNEAEQAALVAEETRKMNENFLNQIENLAAESNALKDERRKRIAAFAATKNEYEATLKFVQDQQQEKLQALEGENKALAAKLAALETSETPSAPATPDVPKTPGQEEMPSPTTPSVAQEEPDTQAPAFAQSDEDLDQSRLTLVNAIRDMDPLSGDALATRYKELEAELGTKSAGRVHFVSGSSQADEAEVAKIEKLATTSATNSQFLIVGFADRSGSAAGNRRLSSKRAKFVAEQLGQKVGNSRVQAIYIGQTARFGPSAENRVVEIWQIPGTPPKQ